jgi:hypothetical protein
MGGSATQQDTNVQYDPASWVVTAVGMVLGLAGLTYVATHPEPLVAWTAEFVLVSLPAATIIYGGYWIATHQLPTQERRTIAKWCLGGSATAALILLGYIGAERIAGETILNPELLVILGALGGGLVALFSAIAAERNHLNIAISSDRDNRLIEADTDPVSAEARTFAKLVLDTRSWYVVQLLQHSNGPLGVETIASQIAAVEQIDTQEAYLDLIHVRLPKLADEHLIVYHPEVETVELNDRATTIADASEELSAAGQAFMGRDQ